MAIEVRIPTILRSYTNGEKSVEGKGNTLSELFYDLDGPIVRITTPHVPLPAADLLEDNAVPTVDRIVETIRRNAG